MLCVNSVNFFTFEYLCDSMVKQVNCSFYLKIGACRHGDRQVSKFIQLLKDDCNCITTSNSSCCTIALLNIYRNPQNTAQSAGGLRCAVSDMEIQEHYDEFFEEVFTEMEEKYGEVEEMNVCDNLGDHLVGNVYVKVGMFDQWFNGQPIHAELSPVTDFREACCRQYEMGECTRGGFCNFMHLKPTSRELRKELYGRHRKRGGGHRSHSCTREGGSRLRERGRGGGEGRDREKRHSRDRERSGRF
uniref:C3H1-type domain-containing protein n=1 Tax=Esox lucius TaxID=8010 RepID=A0A3P8YTY3_ESOLU